MMARLVAVAVGVWLVAAPAALGYDDPAAPNDRIVGPLIASLAFVAAWEVGRPLRWVTLPLGLWMIVAPLALGYDDATAVLNSLASGLVVAATAPIQGRRQRAFGGGWPSLIGRRDAPPSPR